MTTSMRSLPLLLAVVLSVGLMGSAAYATPLAQPNPCTWIPANPNTSGGDTNANYWSLLFPANPAIGLTISGTYPADRYTSFQVYTDSAAVLGDVIDVNFPPASGSVNPLVSGTPRGAGTYTVQVVDGPTPAQPAQGTLYVNAPPLVTVALLYRVYLPDATANQYGNAGLPAVTAFRLADGTPVPCLPPLAPLPPSPPVPTPPVADFQRWPAGDFPNNDNAYLETSLPVTNTLYVIRFQEPATPHTLNGGLVSLAALPPQLRYWSLCLYGPPPTFPQCDPDETVPVGPNGQVTLVLGPTGTQPSNATAANFVQWMALGPLTAGQPITATAIIRDLLPAPNFTTSAFAVPNFVNADASNMGAYAPVITECSTAQFEATACAAAPPATMLAPVAPPVTVTPVPPTDTATAVPPTATSIVTATSTPTSTATPVPPTATATFVPTQTPLPTQAASAPPQATETATAAAAATSTPSPVSPVEVHNAPRTVKGGRGASCDLQANLQALSAGCEIVSSISAPGATVVYTLTYPGPSGAGQTTTDTFTDTADFRGHSLHIFNVPYVPPAGAQHGAPVTIIGVTVAAVLPDGTALLPGETRFVAIQ